jgi:putative hydrolase of HD superfamily
LTFSAIVDFGEHNSQKGYKLDLKKGKIMKNIADLLFEAKILKFVPRAGFHFLGAGRETVAEHSFSVTFIAFIMSKLLPDVDALKLISMCLIHDLAEARTGDHNYVHKRYVSVDEQQAMLDATQGLDFGDSMVDIFLEFKEQETTVARLAHDADQLAFILDLKSISDTGHSAPDEWTPVVIKRLKTDIGRKIAESIMKTKWDAWWMDDYKE